MAKYQTLINILDRIRLEAPSHLKKYHPDIDDEEKINQARSKCFIHLYLKVKFGLLDFLEREHFITDGKNDGGIDGYYISKEQRKIYVFQSKFRTNSVNFENKEISLKEILHMDIADITEGKTKNESGVEYNGKIIQFIREISSIEDIGQYNYNVIIIANLKNVPTTKLRLLCGGFPCEIFDYEKCYNELVFPVVTGTFYNVSDFYVTINLDNKNRGSKVSYKVDTEFKECNITVVYVPTLEIAKILYKYKNSILKYNPRSYLDLANSPVNKAIRDTIIERETNEFALFNNGITMLSDKTGYNENIGVKDRAQLTIRNGQIINGGQTAYTLSVIYDALLKEGRDPESVFDNKEVLLKIITFDETSSSDDANKLNLIEAISKATNQQTEVTDADRRSNDKIQIELQNNIFNNFGYYYERKRGEYGDGIRNKYIERNLIINRDHFFRLCLATDGKASNARSNSENKNFSAQYFSSILYDSNRFREYFWSFICFDILNEIQSTYSDNQNNPSGEINYGHALRYGKYAVTSVAAKYYSPDIPDDEFMTNAQPRLKELLANWLKFEEYAEKLPHNNAYFKHKINEETQEVRFELNYTGYYKGRTINDDLRDYFANI